MSKFLLIFLTFFSFLSDGDISTVSKKNELKEKATTAFEKQDYRSAIGYYKLLRDSFFVNTPALHLNLGQAYYKQNKVDSASFAYNQAIIGNKNTISSIAYLQLGNITFDTAAIALTPTAYKTLKPEKISTVIKASELFKKSLIADYTNQEARYNYEMLKKWLDNMPEDKKEKQKQHEKEEEKKQEQEKKEQQKKEQEKKEKEEQQKKEQDKKEQEKKDQQKKEDQKKDDQQKDGQKDDQKKDGEKDKKDGEKGEKKDDKEGDKSKEKGDKGEKDKENKDQKSTGDKSEEQKKKEQQEKQAQEKGKEGDKKNAEEQNKASEMSKAEKEAKEEAARQQAIEQRLKENNFSKDKALQLLQSIDQQEKKYLQQMERKSDNKQDNNGKPDW